MTVSGLGATSSAESPVEFDVTVSIMGTTALHATGLVESPDYSTSGGYVVLVRLLQSPEPHRRLPCFGAKPFQVEPNFPVILTWLAVDNIGVSADRF